MVSIQSPQDKHSVKDNKVIWNEIKNGYNLPLSGAHGSVVMGVRPVSERPLVQTPL